MPPPAKPLHVVPVSAYIILIIVIVIIIVAAVFITIATRSINNIADYKNKIGEHPKLKAAHQLAAWGASVAWIGVGLVAIILILLAIFTSGLLLRSKGMIWFFIAASVAVAVATAFLALFASLDLINSGAYDPADANAKKGYSMLLYTVLTIFLSIVLAIAIVAYITGRSGATKKTAAAPPIAEIIHIE
jgi:magnesium-transporting ATPase (P-type)